MIHKNSGSFAMPDVNFDKIPESFSSGVNATREMVEENPGTAVFIAFGIGLGIGAGLATLLSGIATPTPVRRSYW